MKKLGPIFFLSFITFQVCGYSASGDMHVIIVCRFIFRYAYICSKEVIYPKAEDLCNRETVYWSRRKTCTPRTVHLDDVPRENRPGAVRLLNIQEHHTPKYSEQNQFISEVKDMCYKNACKKNTERIEAQMRRDYLYPTEFKYSAKHEHIREWLLSTYFLTGHGI